MKLAIIQIDNEELWKKEYALNFRSKLSNTKSVYGLDKGEIKVVGHSTETLREDYEIYLCFSYEEL